VWRRVVRALRGAVADVMDRGAARRRGRAEWPDLWRYGALVGSGGLSLWTEASKVANDRLGLPGSAVPMLLAAAGLAWACFVITAKAKGHTAPSLVSSPATYAHYQPLRWMAKAAVPILAVVFVMQAVAFQGDLVPLPATLYGFLVDGRTGEPAENVSVRVIDAGGVDVTTRQLSSDSAGFYIVHTSRRVRRDARLQVVRPDCSDVASLPLYRSFETVVDAHGDALTSPVRPVFRHTILCAESKP